MHLQDHKLIQDLEEQITRIAADRDQYAADADRRIAALRTAIGSIQGGRETPTPPVAALEVRQRVRGHLRNRVLRILARRGQGTASDVALELGRSAHSYEVANALRDLVSRGLIERTGAHGAALSGRGRAPQVYRVIPATTRRRAA